MGRVLETNHPYDAKRFSWRKEVNLNGADALEVFFHSRHQGCMGLHATSICFMKFNETNTKQAKKSTAESNKDHPDPVGRRGNRTPRPGSATCGRSSTLDQKARFKIFSGGLRRMCAGKFSRVEVAVPGEMWGIGAATRELQNPQELILCAQWHHIQ